MKITILLIILSSTNLFAKSVVFSLDEKIKSSKFICEMEIQKVETVEGRVMKESKLSGTVLRTFKGNLDKHISVRFHKYNNNYDHLKGKKILVFIFDLNGEYRVHNARRGFYLENEGFYDPFSKSKIFYKDMIKKIEAMQKELLSKENS